jgi:hypothetical protein
MLGDGSLDPRLDTMGGGFAEGSDLFDFEFGCMKMVIRLL